MADWQRHLYLNPEWAQCCAFEIAPQQFAAVVAARLRSLEPLSADLNIQRDDLASRFEALAAKPDDRDWSAEINILMNDLWDWGDTSVGRGKRACWVDADPAAGEKAA